MRKQKAGIIGNVGSVCGSIPYPSTGIYSATKFAVAGLTETLRLEVAPFGIEVTVIEPDSFRTKGLAFRRFENRIDDYNSVLDALTAHIDGAGPIGDAAKGAQAIVEVLTKTGRAEGRDLPNCLYVGTMTRGWVGAALDRRQRELKEWEAFTDPASFLEESN